MFQSAFQSQPYFIILAGPYGSNKVQMLENIKRKYNIGNMVPILLDNAIGNDSSYIKAIQNIIDSECNGNAACFDNPNIFSKINKAYDVYEDVKSKKGCLIQENSGEQRTCVQFIQELILISLQKNANISYEIYGAEIPDWIFEQLLQYPMYKVVFAYAIEDFCSLLQRNYQTVKERYVKFINKQYQSTPFLVPDLRITYFKEFVTNIQSNIKKILKSCNSAGCKINNVEFDLLIFSEENRNNMQLIYDSSTKSIDPNTIASAIERIMQIQEKCNNVSPNVQQENIIQTMPTTPFQNNMLPYQQQQQLFMPQMPFQLAGRRGGFMVPPAQVEAEPQLQIDPAWIRRDEGSGGGGGGGDGKDGGGGGGDVSGGGGGGDVRGGGEEGLVEEKEENGAHDDRGSGGGGGSVRSRDNVRSRRDSFRSVRSVRSHGRHGRRSLLKKGKFDIIDE